MRRALLIALPAWALGLGLGACKGQEVTVFEMPMPGGSAGMSNVPEGGSAGSAGMPAQAGDSSGGVAGTSPLAMSGAGGSAGQGGGVGGGPGTPPTPCTKHEDCSPGWGCEKPGCEAKSGFCVPRPLFPKAGPAPVCGCDGITYWNDDVRLQSGATLAAVGQCGVTACACETGADCETPPEYQVYASCSHLISRGEMCGHGMGACWVLPSQCARGADPMQWRECRPPDAPDPPPPCVDTCQAIASEKPHAPLHHDETCN